MNGGTLKRFYDSAMIAFCLLLGGSFAYAVPLERPRPREKLYVPPWSTEVVELATSCKGLSDDECATLRFLVKEVPHAYWVTNETTLAEDLETLHNILLDAQKEKRVPTIVIYSLPNRDCGRAMRLSKPFTASDYKKWGDRIIDALLVYQMPINVIVEPHGLDEVVTEKYQRCDHRTRGQVLVERIALLRYMIWGLAERDDKTKNRKSSKLRIFLDVGGPGRISDARGRLALVNSIEKILEKAEIDGLSVNVGGYRSFGESLAWAKTIIGLMKPELARKLTLAIDIGRSGKKVVGTCNSRGAALDARGSTPDDPDPRVELAIVVKDPSESDGQGEPCNRGAPAGTFDFEVFKDYLRNSTDTHSSCCN
ncbi:MAG: hypothetical protein C5B58_06050 [Acidobacteria bacterium]|nr:MAG: hypothetical protein C5B58_06050 [Acidobacteriota bacterium]